MSNPIVIALVVLIAAMLLWLGHAIVRISWAWLAVREKLSGLRETQESLSQELLVNFREAERLEGETEEMKPLIEAFRQAVAKKRRELELKQPLPPRDVHVSVEVPTSKSHHAWLVRLRRSDAGAQATEEDYLHHFVWAPDRDSAASRGSLLAGRERFQVTQVDRYG